MNRHLLSLLLFLLLIGGVSCRTTRHSATHRYTQLDSKTETISHSSVDSFYRCELTGELEWERVEVTYTLDTPGDTIVPRQSLTREKRIWRLSNRAEQRVTDTLFSTQSQSLCDEETTQIRERHQRTTSYIQPVIILMLILLLIYKLLKK